MNTKGKEVKYEKGKPAGHLLIWQLQCDVSDCLLIGKLCILVLKILISLL